MERLTYDFCLGDIHCWQVKGADNRECRQVCEEQEENGCKGCPIALAFDRLAAYEDTGLTPEEVQIQKEAMERMGWFGKMFQRYKGDPRGPIGTFGNAPGEFLVEFCIAQARNRQALKDVDGNTWLPMLQEEFRAMADFIERVQDWIPVEERLPEKENAQVLMTDGEGWYISSRNNMVRFLDCEGIFIPGKAGAGVKVTHWMHLPQPPKEEIL